MAAPLTRGRRLGHAPLGRTMLAGVRWRWTLAANAAATAQVGGAVLGAIRRTDALGDRGTIRLPRVPWAGAGLAAGRAGSSGWVKRGPHARAVRPAVYTAVLAVGAIRIPDASWQRATVGPSSVSHTGVAHAAGGSLLDRGVAAARECEGQSNEDAHGEPPWVSVYPSRGGRPTVARAGIAAREKSTHGRCIERRASTF